MPGEIDDFLEEEDRGASEEAPQEQDGTIQIHGGGAYGIPARARPEDLEVVGRETTLPTEVIVAGESEAPTPQRRRSILEQMATSERRRMSPVEESGEERVAVQPRGWQRPEDRYQAPTTLGGLAEEVATDQLTMSTPLYAANAAMSLLGGETPRPPSAREASPEARRRGFAAGVTRVVPFVDELGAAIADAAGPEGISPEENLTDIRNQIDEAERVAPEAHTAGIVSGAVGSMAIPGGAVARGAGLGTRALIAGGQVLGAGTLAGVAQSEAPTVMGRFAEAAPMAGVGGAATTGLTLVSPGLGRGLAALGRGAERRYNQSAIRGLLRGRTGDRAAVAARRILERPELIRELPELTPEAVKRARDSVGRDLGAVLDEADHTMARNTWYSTRGGQVGEDVVGDLTESTRVRGLAEDAPEAVFGELSGGVDSVRVRSIADEATEAATGELSGPVGVRALRDVPRGRVDGDALASAIEQLADNAYNTAAKGSHEVVEPLRRMADRFRTLSASEGLPTRIAANLRTEMRDTLEMAHPTSVQAYDMATGALERAIGEISPEMLSKFRAANSRYGPIADLHGVMHRPRLDEVLGAAGGGLAGTVSRSAGAAAGGIAGYAQTGNAKGALVGAAGGALLSGRSITGAIRSASSAAHRGVLRGVSSLLRSSPERLGQAARPLQDAIERGGLQAFQAEHHRQMQSDAQYRQMVEQMEQESENQDGSPEAGQADLDAMMEETF